MNMRLSFATATLAAGLAFASIANAAASAPLTLQSEIRLEKIVVENGVKKVVLVPAKRTVPGNHLLIVNAYHNNSAARIDNFVITNPLPKGVAFAADATDTGQVSVDGGKTWGALATLTVSLANGLKRAAQASDVTHIRWTVPAIAPGAEGSVGYHAVVR